MWTAIWHRDTRICPSLHSALLSFRVCKNYMGTIVSRDANEETFTFLEEILTSVSPETQDVDMAPNFFAVL